ncbi:MAG: ubiquinol--cytochrome-c reductase subunit 6 [Alectoria sarmentosa]|nr:MAG: ubiquinol--cytochrome-c reductase subunit 6 [Alectoria sarmentosa]
MGFSDIFSDFYNSIGFTELHAEAPPEEEKEDDEGGDDKGEEKSDDGDKEEGGEEGGEEEQEAGDDEGGDEEEEEEEEEEPEDLKPKLEAACAKSAQCAPAKHHYDECAERVTKQHENPDHKGPKEDCVEECEFDGNIWLRLGYILTKREFYPVFHLQHCATQCAAPKLFRQLK